MYENACINFLWGTSEFSGNIKLKNVSTNTIGLVLDTHHFASE
jgi:hypothetical protein